MTEPWVHREGATLAVIVDHFSQPGAEQLWLKQLVERTGLAEDELTHRLNRLDRSGFIRADRRGPAIAGVHEVLGPGWRVSTGEPNDQGNTVDIIIGRLTTALERETDPQKKGALRKLLDGFRQFNLELGPKVAAELLAKVILPGKDFPA